MLLRLTVSCFKENHLNKVQLYQVQPAVRSLCARMEVAAAVSLL